MSWRGQNHSVMKIFLLFKLNLWMINLCNIFLLSSLAIREATDKKLQCYMTQVNLIKSFQSLTRRKYFMVTFWLWQINTSVSQFKSFYCRLKYVCIYIYILLFFLSVWYLPYTFLLNMWIYWRNWWCYPFPL